LSVARIFITYLLVSLPTAALCPLSLHDALPISVDDDAKESIMTISHTAPPAHQRSAQLGEIADRAVDTARRWLRVASGLHVKDPDRESTRLNSSHVSISYADVCMYRTQQAENND